MSASICFAHATSTAGGSTFGAHATARTVAVAIAGAAFSIGVGILAEEEGAEGNSKGSYTFVQNNYSPKALSRIDIYRQTRNQFAEFREVANGI